jgi:5-methylcytosine-specific restriction endonuclease McrA
LREKVEGPGVYYLLGVLNGGAHLLLDWQVRHLERPDELLDAARHKSKRDIERLVAALDPQPDIASSVRRQSVPAQPKGISSESSSVVAPECTPPIIPSVSQTVPRRSSHLNVRRAVVAPIAPARYIVKFTVGQETHDKLERARDLLRHAIPNGDPAAIVDRALTILIAQLERTKYAATRRPRPRPAKASSRRHIPAAVKRAVWARDDGRCAFVGTEGRCRETGLLEFHHVVPFAVGGATNTENLQLRCRSHNAHEAERFFPTLSGQSRSGTRGLTSISRILPTT